MEIHPAAATVDKYVCPMPSHAGILYDAPGPCPLCGMTLVPVNAWNLNRAPIAYYTCPMPEHYDVHADKPGKCPKCGMTLIPVTQAEVERFQKQAASSMPPALYTCPMPIHADVVSDKPGTCPKCGMALIPTASVPHGRDAEQQWREAHPSGVVSPATGEVKTILYTCPMAEHADVVSNQPGKCPKCNMTLVPTTEVKHGSQAEAHWKAAHPEK